MTANRPLYCYRLWTVVRGDDDTFDVIDHDGNVVDGAFRLEEAKEACRTGADESYRDRLWDAITEADPSDVHTKDLEQIARLLGIDAGKV